MDCAADLQQHFWTWFQPETSFVERVQDQHRYFCTAKDTLGNRDVEKCMFKRRLQNLICMWLKPTRGQLHKSETSAQEKPKALKMFSYLVNRYRQAPKHCTGS